MALAVVCFKSNSDDYAVVVSKSLKGDTDFYQDIALESCCFSVIDRNDDFWTFQWQAKTKNPNLYPVGIEYYIEFRNTNGSLLEQVGPINHGINTGRDGGAIIADRGIYRMKAYHGKQVDFKKSRLYFRVRE